MGFKLFYYTYKTNLIIPELETYANFTKYRPVPECFGISVLIGTVSRVCLPLIFCSKDSSVSRPHMNRLKRFRELFCFSEDTQLLSSKFACSRSQH